jgi:hypothetical protein
MAQRNPAPCGGRRAGRRRLKRRSPDRVGRCSGCRAVRQRRHDRSGIALYQLSQRVCDVGYTRQCGPRGDMATGDFQVSSKNDKAPFTLKLHRGDGMCLVAMNWKKGKPPNDFVDFAIESKPPDGKGFFP